MQPMWLLLALCFVTTGAHSQIAPAPPPRTVLTIPKPDFVLREMDTPRRQGRARHGGEAVAPGGLDDIAFSGDGKLLALGSEFGRVDLWDIVARQKLRSIDTRQGATVVAISPNGELLATGGDDPAYTIAIWEVASGKRLKQFKGPAGSVDELRFDPNGTRLDVSADGADNSVFDVFTGALLAKLPGARFGRFSRDSSLLVTAGASRIIAWNTADWNPVNSAPTGSDYPTTLAAYPEGGMTVVGGPKVTRLVRLSTGEQVAQLGDGLATFAAFNQDGSLIFTGIDGAIGIWDTTGAERCASPKSANTLVALSTNDRWLAATSTSDTGVGIWDVKRLLVACGVSPAEPGR